MADRRIHRGVVAAMVGRAEEAVEPHLLAVPGVVADWNPHCRLKTAGLVSTRLDPFGK